MDEVGIEFGDESGMEGISGKKRLERIEELDKMVMPQTYTGPQGLGGIRQKIEEANQQVIRAVAEAKYDNKVMQNIYAAYLNLTGADGSRLLRDMSQRVNETMEDLISLEGRLHDEIQDYSKRDF